MDFQLSYYQLQHFVRAMLKNSRTSTRDTHYLHEHLEKLNSFLNEFEFILHKEAFALKMEPLSTDTPAKSAEKKQLMDALRAKAKKDFEILFNKNHPLELYNCFVSLNQMLTIKSSSPTLTVDLTNIQDLSKFFMSTFNVKIDYALTPSTTEHQLEGNKIYTTVDKTQVKYKFMAPNGSSVRNTITVETEQALLPRIVADISAKGYQIQATPSARVTTKDLPSILSTTLNLKLKKSKEAHNFHFHSDMKLLHNMVFFNAYFKQEPRLKAILDDENYAFSEQDIAKLDDVQFDLITQHFLAQIFLLAGFGVTELDAPRMEKTQAFARNLDTYRIQQLIQLAESAKKNIGLDNFKPLLMHCYTHPAFGPAKLPAILNAANSIGNKAPNALARFMNLLQNASSWEALSKELPDILLRAIDESYPPVPDEEVYQSYMMESNDVLPLFMPDKKALEDSIANFQETQKNSKILVGTPPELLKTKLDEAILAYKTAALPEIKKTHEAMIWAILRELFRLSYHMNLHSTQMINAHLILNTPHQKTIAQIKTGEGKSALQVIMMAFQALTTGRKQFNVTTSHFLAERDVVKFKPFYEQLGLKCTSNGSSDPAKGQLFSERSSYAGHIVYGVASDFQFGYMMSMALGNPLKNIIQPNKTDIYVDEVDALIVDQEQSSSRIVGEGHSSVKHTTLYHDIWNYIFEHRAIGARPATHSEAGLAAYLISKNHFTSKTINTSINKHTLHAWYHSACSALNREKDRDYVVTVDPSSMEPCIVIVDRQGTGELMHGRVWSQGLHQIISARENLTVKPEKKLQACISHSTFFNLFNSMFAVTGTIGGTSCHHYLTTMYPGVTIMNLPRYRLSKASLVEPVVSANKTAEYDQLILDIINARGQGRPLLLLFDSIRKTTEFQAYARKRGHPISILTGNEELSVLEDILAYAGLPGNVLAATFIAGRGADIVPSPEAEANRGLISFICSPPPNDRVIWQNFGRTGRQGRTGSFGFRFNREELLVEMNKITINIEADYHWLSKPGDVLDEFDSVGIKRPSQRRPVHTRRMNNAQSSTEERALSLTPMSVTETLKIENEKKQSLLAAQVAEQYDADDKTLLNDWELQREEANQLKNLVNVQHARYSYVVYALQKIIYEYANRSANEDVIESLSEHYDLIHSHLHTIFQQKTLHKFKEYIGTTLLEICSENNINPEEFKDRAKYTGNTLMTECLTAKSTVVADAADRLLFRPVKNNNMDNNQANRKSPDLSS